MNDKFVELVVAAFEEQSLPPRPSNDDTAACIFEDATLDVSSTPQLSDWKKIMKFISPLAAIAACLIFVVSFWPASNNAFAQVVKQIANARTVTFSISMKHPDKPEMVGKASARRPHLLRIDWTVAGQTNVNITDYSLSELMSFGETSPVTVHAIPDSGGFDIVRQLLKVDAKLTKSDAKNDIAKTNFFEFKEGDSTGRLWSDEQTALPVRIEMDVPKELGGGQTVFSEFEWDNELEETTFKIPADRKILRNNLLAEPTEEELVSAFRIRQAFSNAPYSKDFLSNDCGLAIGQLAYERSLSRAENHERQLEALGPVLTSIGITQIEARAPNALQQRIDYLCMKADQWDSRVTRNGGWVGGGVAPGENKPLCWWKIPSNGIRVLNADLTIVDAKVAPQR